MTMTDPIADFLTRLRNANTAYHDEVKLPSSKIKVNIAEILKREATSPTTAPRTPRWARPSSSTSSTDLPVSAASPACVACRSPACACTRNPPTCQGPGRPRRGDHLHVLRSAHRSPGGQAGSGRGSPRLRLVKGGHHNVANRKTPRCSSFGRRGHHRRPGCCSQGPQGQPVPDDRRADRHRQGRGRGNQRHAPERRASQPCAARPVADARAEPHRRRDRGLHHEDGDPRRRLPRGSQGQGPRVLARLQPPRADRGSRGITFAVENPTRFSISGIDKQKVGQIAANIRRLRKSDPYKGKGIRYEGEQVRRKVGKTGK